MTKPIAGHRCRKVLNELLLVADHAYRSFGADNPRLEKADHALMDAIKLLREAADTGAKRREPEGGRQSRA